jgi:hypothetical protein
MAMDFPNSPTVNQTYTVGDKTWKWTGSAWEIVATRPAMRTVADTPPASPMVGDEWFNSLTGRTYTWFDSYWVEVNTNSIVGASGLNGVASASAPLVYTSGSNNISVQFSPTFTGTVSAPSIATTGGRLRTVGESGDTSGVLELQSYDGVKNYVYKQNGSGLVFANLNGAQMATYNASGHITTQYQPMFQCGPYIAGTAGNAYLDLNNDVTTNVGFTLTNNTTLTVQTAGKYLVVARHLMSSTGSNYYHIQKNNATIKHGWTNNIMIDYGVSALIECSANDTLRLYLGNAIAQQWNGAHSSLMIVKVA